MSQRKVRKREGGHTDTDMDTDMGGHADTDMETDMGEIQTWKDYTKYNSAIWSFLL